MKNLNSIKKVKNIEYVGPYQIQTTSSRSISFSSRIEVNMNLEDFYLVPNQSKDSAMKIAKTK